VNAGLYIINPRLLREIHGKCDLDRELLAGRVPSGDVYGYRSTEYVKDMGTMERLAQVEADIGKGIVAARNLSLPQKAIFLDRDGTLNRDMDKQISLENFALFPESAQALRLINKSEYLAIVATNQPMIAKGFITFEDLRQIHAKMETLLGKEGAYVDAVYFCPHHPERGFAGEVRELKIDCDCRKPKPGMLLRAAADHHIDLGKSWLIGDSDRDMEAASNAGVKAVRIGAGVNVLDAVRGILG